MKGIKNVDEAAVRIDRR